MGEFELLARIRERLPPSGPRMHLSSGDDAAVTVPGGATATSVDALVEGVHFRRDLASPAQIGHKALATALSDLAAMGAEAGEAYIVIGLPPDFGEEQCLELLDGMTALATATGTDLAGGDLTRASELFLAITVTGHAPSPNAFVTRGGARPGDALVVTGEIGSAAAGLHLLQNADCSIDPLIGGSKDQSAPNRGLLARQLEPMPQLLSGQALARAGATAMIDLSDGLGADARHLAQASGVKLEIEAEAVPLAPAAVALSRAVGRDRWRLLSGGEDYELLACVPPDRLKEATAAVGSEGGTTLTKVGEVQGGSGVEIRLPDGRLLEPAGFDQLA